MRRLQRTWLTVDFDDLRHVPSAQGHPTRSRPSALNKVLSDTYRVAMKGFESWLADTTHPTTLFVIADLFESDEFGKWFDRVLKKHGQRLTVGCHGLTHRSWSAWPEDKSGFSSALKQATAILSKRAPDHFRHWFRAPAGYIAPWMAEVLAQERYVVDSSVNPSWVVAKKAGKGNSWSDVMRAMRAHNVIERPWATRLGLPANGPALTMFPLSLLAKGLWKNAPTILSVDEVDEVIPNRAQPIVTLYWHVLDHARNDGAWLPPLR